MSRALGFGAALLPLLFASAAWGAQPTPEQDAAERAALLQQREALAREHAQAVAQCYHRFMVNDCLNAQQRAERKAREDIDARLAAIARRERERAAAAELQRVRDNERAAREATPSAAEVSAARARREGAEREREQRQAQAAQQAAARARPAASRPAAASKPAASPVAPARADAVRPNKPAPPTLDTAQRARNEAAYRAKVDAYRQGQQEAQRQSPGGSAPAPPLPVPSAPR